MQQQIHPERTPTVFTCANCGTQIKTASTTQNHAKLDVCSNCHPAYTGVALKEASGDRIAAFNDRYKSK